MNHYWLTGESDTKEEVCNANQSLVLELASYCCMDLSFTSLGGSDSNKLKDSVFLKRRFSLP